MKFIVAKEAGKLARWLRILGFDTVYFGDRDIRELIIQALREERHIITRKKDIGHLQKRTVVVNSDKLFEQLKELKEKLDLVIDKDKMFSRCTLCNVILKEVDKEEIKSKLPPYLYQHKEYFKLCMACGKIYWQGSHWGNVKEVTRKLGLIADK